MARGLPRAGREGEWGALIGRAPGEMVGLAALLLGDFGVRPSEKARFWAGEREFGAKRKKEEKQCEAQVISVCLVRCEGRMLTGFIAEGRWRWVFVRCAFRERLFLRWCVWGCFSPPPARPAAHSLSTTTGTSRQCLRAFGLPMHTRLSPSPRSGGLPDGG